MKHYTSDSSPEGPSYIFDDKTGKWRQEETQRPLSSWRKRSRDRHRSRIARNAQLKDEGQGGQIGNQTEHWCSDGVSTGGGEGLEVVSSLASELPPMTTKGPMAPSPKSQMPSASSAQHERGDPCLICDLRLTGARLVELEDWVEQLMQGHCPL